MTEKKEPLKVIFAPGFFDSPVFAEMSDAERAEVMAEIEQLVASGELLANSEPVDPDDIEAWEAIERSLEHGTRHQ